jgi:hypothetical protein
VSEEDAPDSDDGILREADAIIQEDADNERRLAHAHERRERLATFISALNRAGSDMEAAAEVVGWQRPTGDMKPSCLAPAAKAELSLREFEERLRDVMDELRRPEYAEQLQRIDLAVTVARYRGDENPRSARIACNYAFWLIDRALPYGPEPDLRERIAKTWGKRPLRNVWRWLVVLLDGIAGGRRLGWREQSPEGPGEIRKLTKRARRSTKSRTRRRPAAPPMLPLTDNQWAVLAIIKKQPKGKGISGKEIIRELQKEGIELLETTLRRHVIPGLKPHSGVVNIRARGGYLVEE